jgi:hypothetical protein
MRTLSLLLLLATSTPLFGQSAQNSPLSDSEKRIVLGQLYELRACREQVVSYEQYVARDTEQDARERENSARALELERQATALAQKERDLALDKAAFYEQALRTVTKKPGKWCWFKRFITLGIARCN